MCVHYWMVDSSNKGICKLCRFVKDFSQPMPKIHKREKSMIESMDFDYYMRSGIKEDVYEKSCLSY